MKRIALVTGLVLVAAALAGVLRPDGAGAVDPTTTTDTVTRDGNGLRRRRARPGRGLGRGRDAAPDREGGPDRRTRAAMQKVIAALRANGGKDVTTQTVSLSTAFDDNGQPNGFVASNVASAETSLDGAGALIDAAVAAGANTVYGPSLSRSRRRRALPAGAREGGRRREGAGGDPREGRGALARPGDGDRRVRIRCPVPVRREGLGSAGLDSGRLRLRRRRPRR